MQAKKGEVMGKITVDQSQQVIATFMTNCNWEEIDFEALGLQDAVIRNSQEAGKQFTAFLKNRARLMIGGDPRSIITKPFDLVSFIGKGWAIWKGPIDGDGLSGEEDVDPRGLALAEIQVSKLLFETNLKKGETMIKGEEKLHRQKLMSIIRLGGNAFLGLWLDYQTNKENSVLEWIYRTYKITFMDFMGLVFRSPYGHRYVLYLYRGGDGGWRWGYGWLDVDWDAGDPSACSQV